MSISVLTAVFANTVRTFTIVMYAMITTAKTVVCSVQNVIRAMLAQISVQNAETLVANALTYVMIADGAKTAPTLNIAPVVTSITVQIAV